VSSQQGVRLPDPFEEWVARAFSEPTPLFEFSRLDYSSEKRYELKKKTHRNGPKSSIASQGRERVIRLL